MKQSCRVWAGIITLLTVGCASALAEEIQRDYPFEKPIPATGRLTQRLPLVKLPAAKQFKKCPAATKLVEYAESTSFQVMICADKKDLRNDKFWLQKSKKTGKLTQIAARKNPNAPGVLWESGDYRVMIYADGARPNTINAYVESYNLKTKRGRGEALLYHYSMFYPIR
jgi:hypothetical protein